MGTARAPVLVAALLLLLGCQTTSEGQPRTSDAEALPPLSTTSLVDDSVAALRGRDAGIDPTLVLDVVTESRVESGSARDQVDRTEHRLSYRSAEIDGHLVLVRDSLDRATAVTTSTAIGLGENDVIYERTLPDGAWQAVASVDLPVGRSWTIAYADDYVAAEMVFTVLARDATAPDGPSGCIHLRGAVLRWREDIDLITVDDFDTITDQWIEPGIATWRFRSTTSIDGSSAFGDRLPHRITVDSTTGIAPLDG